MSEHEEPLGEFWCETCDERMAEGATLILTVDTTFPVMKLGPITVTMPRRVCGKCGTWIGDMELDDAAMLEAYRVFRQKHGIPDGYPPPVWLIREGNQLREATDEEYRDRSERKEAT